LFISPCYDYNWNFLFNPFHHLIPNVCPRVVDMSVVLATCHVVEGVVKADAQNSVLQLRYVAHYFLALLNRVAWMLLTCICD
jgi:hypothetical protein